MHRASVPVYSYHTICSNRVQRAPPRPNVVETTPTWSLQCPMATTCVADRDGGATTHGIGYRRSYSSFCGEDVGLSWQNSLRCRYDEWQWLHFCLTSSWSIQVYPRMGLRMKVRMGSNVPPCWLVNPLRMYQVLTSHSAPWQVRLWVYCTCSSD